MVFLTSLCMKYMPYWFRKPDKRGVYFRRVAVFRLTAAFGGRSRNCWKNAINKLHKTLEYKVKYRRIRTNMLHDLYAQRVLGAVEEHGFKYEYFLSALAKSGIELNRKSLATLAVYEPNTFESLVNVSKAKFKEEADGEVAKNTKVVDGIITRGML